MTVADNNPTNLSDHQFHFLLKKKSVKRPNNIAFTVNIQCYNHFLKLFIGNYLTESPRQGFLKVIKLAELDSSSANKSAFDHHFKFHYSDCQKMAFIIFILNF